MEFFGLFYIQVVGFLAITILSLSYIFIIMQV